MRIPTLAKFLDNFTTSTDLNNSTLVIDAQNFFYLKYEQTDMPFIFGCESDKYLEYLKNVLKKFKIANVKCYFIFKGGHKSIDEKKKSMENKEKFMAGQKFQQIVLSTRHMNTVPPIFMWEIHRQALKEMGFDYTVCEYEHKSECIALAQKLKCPILSYDIEFCFSGVSYISYYTLKLDQRTQALKGNVFTLDHFLQELGANEDKLAIFAAMMDLHSYFPPEYITEFLNSVMEVPRENCEKYTNIFQWMASMTQNEIMENICKDMTPEDRARFVEIRDQMKDMIDHQETPGIASEYILNGCHIDITPQDPLWFEKGVASGMISVLYINLYRASTVFGSQAIVDHIGQVYSEADQPVEPLLFSTEIIRYAYDLLTNFQGQTFEIITSQSTKILVPPTNRIPKPLYEAQESVFENGWDEIKSLGLFDHFLAHTIPGLKLQILEDLQEDAKLLMIALLFFKRYSNNEAKNEIVGSVILSHVFLGVVNENTLGWQKCQSSSYNWRAERALNAVSETDKKLAKDRLSKYVSPVRYPGYAKLTYKTACDMFEPKLMHPLVELQHCMDHFNFLNKLCGSSYEPIVFSKVYNGTFVYQVLYKMVQKGDVIGFLTDELISAPSVLGLVKNLLNVYNEV